MSTRLITNLEESKALRDAGWPQFPESGKHMYFHTETGNAYPFSSRVKSALSVRLDELLAFLWEQDIELEIRNVSSSHVDGPQGWVCDGYLGADQLAAIVANVLDVLRDDAPSTTHQNP